MNLSYIKILLFCNKNSPVPISSICNKFRLTRDQAHQLTTELKELGYVYFVGATSVSATYKSQTVIKSLIYKWLFNNLLAIVAIIISIIALFK